MKERSKTSETELSNEEIANLSDGEFKALVFKMLTELIELSCEMKEEMKATQVKYRKIYRKPAVNGRKLGLNLTIWNRRKK